jgi:hypothetical protein
MWLDWRLPKPARLRAAPGSLLSRLLPATATSPAVVLVQTTSTVPGNPAPSVEAEP